LDIDFFLYAALRAQSQQTERAMDKRLNEQTVNQLLVKSNGQDNYSNNNDDW